MLSSSLLPTLHLSMPLHVQRLYHPFNPHTEWKKPKSFLPPNPTLLPPSDPIPHDSKSKGLELGPKRCEPNQLSGAPVSQDTGNSLTIPLIYNQKLRHLLDSKALPEAMDLYVEIRSRGVEPGVDLESMLIDVLMKSGGVLYAFRVFEAMSKRNVVTWSTMILGCVRNGHQRIGLSLFVEMLKSGVVPNDFALNAVLQACADMEALGLGEQVHSLVVRSGLADGSWTGNCLIDFYSRCGLMGKAKLVAEGMLELDLVSFTSLISGFCKNSLFESAVRVFDQMVRCGLKPNEHTVTSILTACGPLLGEQIHGYMTKTMINQSVYSSSALIEFYSRNFELEKARVVFGKLEAKNVVTWSSMISCCLQNEKVKDAFRTFVEMVCVGIKPNEYSFAAAIGACRLSSEYIAFGLQLHCSAIKHNLVLDNRVSNALLTMYARSGQIEEMEKLFMRIQDLDVVSWCAAISGYFQNGFDERSIRLLRQMHRNRYIPNEYGISIALTSCANLALLDQGKQFHCLALKLGCDLDTCMGNALINMYAKCGGVKDARLAFDIMHARDVMSWNSLIHGYANHGHGEKALEVFKEMVESNDYMPDHSTFVGILVGCSHMGFFDEAIRFFKIMTNHYGIVPSTSHYACMIDMMGRAGRLDEARHIIDSMPFEPDVLIWKTFLGSCRLHGNLALGKLAAEKVIGLSPEDSASYVLLSHLHSMHGKWEDAERVRRCMEERGAKKEAGWSWIEIKSTVHAFNARDRSHPKAESIYQRLEDLFKVMKDKGYSADTSFISSEQYDLGTVLFN